MSSINSSAYYSVGGSGSGSNGISGLMSGMDTEQMVNEMLAGTQSKIDAKEASKLQATWKQQIYRDMIDTINTFQKSFFDLSYGSSSKNNLANDSFFNNMLSKVTSGNALKVLSSSSSALSGDMKIAVEALASSSKFQSKEALSDHTIQGSSTATTIVDGKKVEVNVLSDEMLSKAFSKDVGFDIKLGAVTTEVNINLNGVTTEDEMVERFNAELKGTGVTAKIFDGKMRLVTDNPATEIILATDDKRTSGLGLEMSGINGNASYSNVTDDKGEVIGRTLQAATKVDMDAGRSIDLTLDGVTKTIHISDIEGSDGSTAINAKNLLDTLTKKVDAAFGSYVKVEGIGADGKPATGANIVSFNFSENMGGEKGHELRITGGDSAMFGIASGSSSRFNTSEKLSNMGAGDRFSFTINDVDFTFDGNTSISKMVNEVNNSGAGVKISYSSMSDTMKIESTSSGKGHDIDIKQTEGDILTKLFGTDIAAAPSIVSEELTVGKVGSGGFGLESGYTAKSGASMTMNVNGADYTFTLPSKTDTEGKQLEYSKKEIEEALNADLKKNFGVDAAGDANISFDAATGDLTAKEGFAVRFETTTVNLENGKEVEEAQKTDLTLAFGFNKKANNNLATADTKVSDIYGLKDIAGIDTTKTLGTLTSIPVSGGAALGVSFSDGRLVHTGSGELDFSAPENAGLAELFNGEKFVLGDGANKNIANGSDAVIYVNGEKTTRSSNTITIDGVTMELTQVSKADADSTEAHKLEETVISTSRNDDQIVEGVKLFVEEYNKMIDKLAGLAGEDADYKEYPPLTKAQKAEMSENEIKLWEEKSKVGLVRNDSNINELLSSMRAVIYSKPEGSDFSLYQIGIETTADYEDQGKLQIDEDALRKAIASDPDGVRTLFTDKEDGISKQLVDAMERTANESSANPGTMVQSAGVKGKATEKNNEMHRSMENIESQLENLYRKFELEKTRYWNQFNSMETMMANYNSQSSMISQQFSGY